MIFILLSVLAELNKLQWFIDCVLVNYHFHFFTWVVQLLIMIPKLCKSIKRCTKRSTTFDYFPLGRLGIHVKIVNQTIHSEFGFDVPQKVKSFFVYNTPRGNIYMKNLHYLFNMRLNINHKFLASHRRKKKLLDSCGNLGVLWAEPIYTTHIFTSTNTHIFICVVYICNVHIVTCECLYRTSFQQLFVTPNITYYMKIFRNFCCCFFFILFEEGSKC